ncbi:MAG: NAD(P)H-hydrate epimerase [Balneolaceae bacterium]
MVNLRDIYSYRVCSAKQCRAADRKTIDDFGVDGFTLMETAGLQAARSVSQKIEDGATGLFICGKGNNAGDALVVARYLAINNRHSCTILFMFGQEDLSTDTNRNLNLLKSLAQQGLDIQFTDDVERIREARWDYLADGMIGTGLASELRAPLDRAVHLINEQDSTVFALDMPTGIHTDSGVVMGCAVKADYTLSFGALKTGYYLQNGPVYAGTIEQINLTFPDSLRESAITLLDSTVADTFPPVIRHENHKYSNGVLYIIAGSEGLTGAAIMAAKSAWASGTGAIFLLAPRGLLPIYEQCLPQIIKCPVGTPEERIFSVAHINETKEILARHKGALLIGPGLGRDNGTVQFTRKILEHFSGNAVIDADALVSFSGAEQPGGCSWIVTPHPGELKHIGHTYQDDYSRLDWATSYMDTRNLSVVSKGDPTIARMEDGHCYVTGYDTKIFSRAGFGDLLSGMIAGYLSFTGDPEQSILSGLTDGYRKVKQFKNRHPHTPVEPEHLI